MAGTRPTVPVQVYPKDAPTKGVDEESTSEVRTSRHRRCIVDVTLGAKGEGGGCTPEEGGEGEERGGPRGKERASTKRNDQETKAKRSTLPTPKRQQSPIAHLILETREHQIRPFPGLLRSHLCPRFTDRPLPRTTNHQLATSCNLTSSFMNVD